MFAEQDPSGVPFALIAAEAGVSRNLVYAYFGDRGGLLAAACNYEFERLDAQIAGGPGSVTTSREQVARAVSAYLGLARRRPHSWPLIASASSCPHPAVRALMQARTDRIAATIADSPTARLIVRCVTGMLEAAAVHVFENDDADLERLSMLLTQVIWEGVSSLEDGGEGGRSDGPD